MSDQAAAPPKFVMWKSVPHHSHPGWERQWFGNELEPEAVFNVRGVGIREPMFNPDVHRPIGTGDWLIMFFHEPARLSRKNAKPLVGPHTLILWPPGAEQFYSWGKAPNIEPHSWMHVEGTWVAQQVKENCLPTDTPITLECDQAIVSSLQSLMSEMTQNESPDLVILQNVFQNWARRTARYLHTRELGNRIPESLLNLRAHLDEHYSQTVSLDELARIACMSRSHLCHQFREYFGTTISNYVIRRRMSIAQRLLFEVHLRPGEIAKEVGYPDIYQFSKQFKKCFGVSPTQYRKQHTSS